jgi:nitroreductase
VELAASRRSVRQFLQEEIPDSLVAELLSVVQFCPTGVNAQGMTVVVWRGERVRKNLFEPLAALLRHLRLTGLTWLAGILSGQGSFMTRVMGGEDLVFRGAPLVLFFFAPRKNPTGAADGDIAATTVMLHASTMGLGTFWNGVARVVYPVMRGWHAGAPKGGRLRAVLCVGRPLRKPSWLVPGRDWTALEAGNRAEREPVTTGAAP